MKKSVERIKYVSKFTEICSFYICNIFKIDTNKVELKDIMELDLLDEKYFQKIIKPIKTTPKIQNQNLKYLNNRLQIRESYGPILKSTITTTDFEKHNFKEYNSRIESIIDDKRKAGDDDEANDLKTFHAKFLNELNEYNLEKRDYYFLDSDLIEKKRRCELEWIYAWFFATIGIDERSKTVIILNYGND